MKRGPQKLGKFSYAHLVKTRPELGLPVTLADIEMFNEFQHLRGCKTVPQLVAQQTAAILSGHYVPESDVPF